MAERAPNRESGYALLLVLLMAAIIAISLYSEIPRVALQSQRAKEQLLIERGLQYQRGIEVFRQANPRQWPRNLDDVLEFNGRHFARHKYVDPMTGKSEWRLIHAQGNILTDSLVTKGPANQQSISTDSNYISSNAGVGQAPANAAPGFRPQDRRRPSEGGAGSEGQIPMIGDTGTEPDAPQPGELPAPGAGANPAAGGAAPGTPGAPGSAQPGQAPDAGGSYISASGGVGATYQPQPVAGGPIPPRGMQGLPGQPQTPNAALGMINRILTSPNPQAQQIIQQAQQQAGGGNAVIGAGLAGVASTADQEGVMVYNDRTNYKEWEFVFDPTKVLAIQRPGVTQVGSQQSQTSSGSVGAPGMQLPPGMSARTGQAGAGAQGGGSTPGMSGGPAGMQNMGGAPAGPPAGYRPGRP